MAFSAADQTAVEQAIQDLATGHRLVRITLKGNTNDQSNGHPIIHSAVYPIGHICEPFFFIYSRLGSGYPEIRCHLYQFEQPPYLLVHNHPNCSFYVVICMGLPTFRIY